MKKTFAAVAVIPFLATSVWAQEPDRTTATASTTKASDESPGQTRAIRTEEGNCPVTANTVSFGLLTRDGRYLRFDQPSNKLIVEMAKNSDYTWNGTLLDATCFATYVASKDTKTKTAATDSTNETPGPQKKPSAQSNQAAPVSTGAVVH